MSVAITDWSLRRKPPHGSWWRYENDRRLAELWLLGLAIMALASVALIIWAVLVA